MRQRLDLAPYQLDLSDHQLANPASMGIMGCGLGKTAATLSSVVSLLLSGEAKRVLVVAPLRVATLTWPAECAKWDITEGILCNPLRTAEAWERAVKPGIHTVNYEALPKVAERTKAIGLFPFDTVIFDESTRAKNPQSKRINELRPLLAKARRRWALTGTPAPNSLMDLFAQVRLLDDGKLFGPSFEAFKRRWFYPIDYMEYDWRPVEGAKEAIYAQLEKLAIVRRSEDYLDIADTHIEDIEVALPDRAKRFYKDLEKDLIAKFNRGELLAVNAAVLTNKLLQVTSGAVYHEDKTVEDIHDGKIRALQHLMKTHKGEPLLVACNYRHEQERIARLPGAVRFDSAKSDRAQTELVARWNAGEIPLLVSDPRSIGHGLNLQAGGRIVVWFSPTYSRESYDQFNARLARRGQALIPVVYRLVCPNTIDDAVLEALREKGDEQSALMGAVANLAKMRLT